MNGPTAIHYVCIGGEHLRVGLAVPNQRGHLTIHQGKWAYCSAGRGTEEHQWAPIAAAKISDLRHATLRERAAHEGSRMTRASNAP